MNTYQAGRNLSDVKFDNRALIFRTIYSKSPISRAELAKETGLNAATITHIIREFQAQGLVEETGFGEPKGGRRSSLLEISANRGCILSVSVGRFAIRGALVDLGLREITRRTLSSSSFSYPVEITLTGLLNIIRSIIQDSGIDPKNILGIGVGSPGPLDNQRGILISPPNFPGWPHVALRQRLEDEIGIATFLDNDANVCALAEKWLGAAKDYNNFVYLLDDAGIGGGVVINGEIYRGTQNFAGEIGHTTIDLNGRQCVCGNVGCLELYASWMAAREYVRQKVMAGSKSAAVDKYNGDLENLSFESIVQAAKEGDYVALEALDSVASALGAGIVNVINTFDPEAILIGGKICLAGEFLFDTIQGVVVKRMMSTERRSVKILPGSLQEDASLLGPSCLVFQELFQNPHKSFNGSAFGPLPLHK